MENDSSQWQYYEWLSAYSSEQIKEINKAIDKEDNKLENPELGLHFKNITTVKSVKYGAIKHLISTFVDSAFRVAQNDFGYTVFPFQDVTLLNYNTYDSKNKADYDWHTDGSRSSTNDIKLTVLINLSEKIYRGGEFQILTSAQPQTIESYSYGGSAFMFKSHILHKVKPLTHGVRKSLSLFLHGPRFQ